MHRCHKNVIAQALGYYVKTRFLSKCPMMLVVTENAMRLVFFLIQKTIIVFDVSAKSSTGVSLNDNLMVGSTVHSPLIY